MAKILIVDDNLERSREITSVIENFDNHIEYATTKNEALCKFEQEQYDLAIIDIMLPQNMSELNPSVTAGIELIEDIGKRKRVKAPKNIIGITSYDEMYEKNQEFFEDRLIPILCWRVNDKTWKEKILNKIEHINLICKNNPPIVDVAILTAVDDEFNAVKESFGQWEQLNIPNDPTTYFITEITTTEGTAKKIVLNKLPQMGLTAASNATTKLIHIFSPKQIFMIGICGGVKGSVKLGDIIVADNTWDYGCGKIKPRSDDSLGYYTFEPSPNQIPIEPHLSEKLKYSADKIIEGLSLEWNLSHKEKPIYPNVRFGPMPSGAAVICDTMLFNEIVKPQHRKCLGLDMETYGVYYAIKYTTVSPIEFLSIKAVSDYADEEKNDEYHEASCYFSSNFLKECLINNIL